MTIYAIDNKNNNSVIAALICIKFIDVNSLIKIFSLLRATYDQIKALKNCDLFIKNLMLYVVYSFFHS